MIDYILAPVVIAHGNWFAFTFSIKGVAVTFEFFSQLDVVVNFAVKRQRIALWVVFGAPAQWLVRMLQVNNGQAVEAKDRIVVVPRACGVRPAVVHASQAALDCINIFCSGALCGEHAQAATHRWLIRLSTCGLLVAVFYL